MTMRVYSSPNPAGFDTVTIDVNGAAPAANGRPLPTRRIQNEEPPNSTRVLLLNMAWMLFGNIAFGFSQWGQLVALAKVGNIEMVGSFALALALCLPVLMFSSLSLRALQVTDQRRSYRFLEYMSLRLVTLALSLVFIIAFGVVAGHPGAVVISTALIGAAKAMEYISDILYGTLQHKENMSGIAISMSLRSMLSVGALSLGVALTHSLAFGAACMLVSSSLVLFAYDIPKTLAIAKFPLQKVLAECISYLGMLNTADARRRLWKLAMSGLPMGFVLMLVSLNLNIPRYFIEQHLGIQQLAIFSAIATLLAAGGSVTNAAGQAAAPRLAKSFVNHDRRGFALVLTGMVVMSLGLGALGFSGAFFFGKQAMTLIYRPEYSTHQDVLLWLMAASGFFYLGSTLGYAVTAVRCFTPQLPLFAGAAVTTAIGCLILVPSRGLRGAAMAILLSAIIQCLGGAYLLWKACRQRLVASIDISDRALEAI